MTVYFKNSKITQHFTVSEYNMDSSSDCFMNSDTLVFIQCIEEFRVWVDRRMYVTSWFRSYAVNKAVGGISSSNHLTGTAMDFYCKNISYADKFIKYVKKWNQICKAHGRVAEAGLYTWGFHFGIQNEAQAAYNGNRLFHWDSRTGTQINKPFRELNAL